MKLISLLLILLISFWGCKKENKKSVTNTVDSQRVVDSIDSKYYQVPEFHKTISINVFEKRDITIKNPEDYFEVLLALFPGMIAVDSSYDEPYEDSSVTWLTKNHPEKKVWDPFWPNDSTAFPFLDGNETRFEELLYYTTKGEKYCAIFYSTFSCYYPWVFERTSTHTYPVWGVSVFKKTNIGWKLTTHEPAFACLKQRGPIEKIIFNDISVGFVINGITNGAGEYIGNYLIYRFEEPLKLLLIEKAFDFSISFDNSWGKSAIKLNNNTISLTTSGYIDPLGIDTGYLTWVLDTAFLNLFKAKDTVYKFTYTKTYTPDSIGNYRLNKTSLKKKYSKIRTGY